MAFNDQRQAIINGLDSAQSESGGWNNTVRDAILVGTVTRESDTQVKITTGAISAFVITADETITVTIPAAALTGAQEIVASPTFTVYAGIRRTPNAMVLAP